MTKVTLDKIFDTKALMRELGQVPLEMAEEYGEERVEDMRREKSGVKYKRLGFRSSRRGESPREQSKKLTGSKRVKRTGPASAKLSFDDPKAEILEGKDRPILPESDMPQLEKRQLKKVEKVLDKFV